MAFANCLSNLINQVVNYESLRAGNEKYTPVTSKELEKKFILHRKKRSTRYQNFRLKGKDVSEA